MKLVSANELIWDQLHNLIHIHFIRKLLYASTRTTISIQAKEYEDARTCPWTNGQRQTRSMGLRSGWSACNWYLAYFTYSNGLNNIFLFLYSGYSDEVTRFLQGYVDNEVNLNELNDCKKSCSDYKNTQNYLCFNGSYCANDVLQEQNDLKCNGAVVNCEFIGADMTICPSVSILS